MSASNACETALLELIYKNTAFAGIGDGSGLQPSGTPGYLYVSLHTGDPGEAGDQETSEADYTSYARVGVARSAAGWTVTGPLVENAAAVTFAQCTGGTNTITHFGVGTASSGAGVLLFSGALSDPSSLPVASGITPEFAAGVLTNTCD